MKNEPDVVHETPAEVVEDQALAIRQPTSPLTIYHLAQLEVGKGGVNVVEAVDRILQTLRRAAIQQTMPDDWTLYKTPQGRVTGYLEDQGCKRITKLWRIEVYNFGPKG